MKKCFFVVGFILSLFGAALVLTGCESAKTEPDQTQAAAPQEEEAPVAKKTEKEPEKIVEKVPELPPPEISPLVRTPTRPPT